YLHEPALPVAAIFVRIEPALTPNDRFHEHGIELMFDRDDANEAVVPLKSRRAHPFVNRVNWVPRYDCEVNEARSQRQHHAEDQFEEKSYHFSSCSCSCSCS